MDSWRRSDHCKHVRVAPSLLEIAFQPIFDIEPENGDTADRKQRHRKCNAPHAEQGAEQDDRHQCPCGRQLDGLTLNERADHVALNRLYDGIDPDCPDQHRGTQRHGYQSDRDGRQYWAEIRHEI